MCFRNIFYHFDSIDPSSLRAKQTVMARIAAAAAAVVENVFELDAKPADQSYSS